MNSISVSIYLQEEQVVCPQCGSTVRLAHDVCLRCMLLLGIAAGGDTSQTLNDLLSEIDVQDAECRDKAGIASGSIQAGVRPARITVDIRIEANTLSSQQLRSCFRVLLNASPVSAIAFRGSSVNREAKL